MAILPWRTWHGRVVTDPRGAQSATDDCTVRLVAIPKEIARSLIPGERLDDLARDPFRGRIRGDVGPYQASPLQPHDRDPIEKPKAYGRHDELSMAAMSGAWLRSKVRHSWLGGTHHLTMYLATVDWATSKPSLSSSPCMRGAPQSEFSLFIRLINARRCSHAWRDRDPSPSPVARLIRLAGQPAAAMAHAGGVGHTRSREDGWSFKPTIPSALPMPAGA